MGGCSECLFQDHDALLLYDRSLDGIEDPDSDQNQDLGMGDPRPGNWFTPFDSVEPRGPNRGFRR